MVNISVAFEGPPRASKNAIPKSLIVQIMSIKKQPKKPVLTSEALF